MDIGAQNYKNIKKKNLENMSCICKNMEKESHKLKKNNIIMQIIQKILYYLQDMLILQLKFLENPFMVIWNREF